MKNITGFSINQSTLLQSSSNRQFTVTGETGAEFLLQVFNTPTGASDQIDFYNFTTGSFTSSASSETTLAVKMSGTTYNGSITFPTNASGDTYTILMLAPPDKDTVLSIGDNKHSYTTTIAQVANTTLTFTPITASSANYKTFPTSVTSVTSPAIPSNVTKSLSWAVENTESDARGFGLRLIRQPIDTDWYFTVSDTVNNRLNNTIEKTFSTVDGIVDGAVDVTLEDDYTFAGGGPIAVGDYAFLTTEEGSLTLGTTVAAVNVGSDPNEITLSAAVTIADDESLEFITATKEIIVDDLTDIVTGMVVSAVSGTNAYLNGTPTITAINTETNTLTLSIAQAFVDGVTLVFQARGSNVIKKATGANIDFSGWNADVTSAVSAQLTKTVRGDSDDSTTIALNGTYGISGGSSVSIAGLGMVNTSANYVVTNRTSSGDATASENAGEIITTLAQSSLTVGSTLYFTGSTQKVTITNTIPISRNPDANRTIYLNLDNFITVGVAS